MKNKTPESISWRESIPLILHSRLISWKKKIQLSENIFKWKTDIPGPWEKYLSS